MAFCLSLISTHGSSFKKIYQCYYYKTKNVPELDALTGRLIIAFPRPGRQCCLIAELLGRRNCK